MQNPEGVKDKRVTGFLTETTDSQRMKGLEVVKTAGRQRSKAISVHALRGEDLEGPAESLKRDCPRVDAQGNRRFQVRRQERNASATTDSTLET